MAQSDAQTRLPVLLLIDDDLVSREVTATLLTMSGYTVHTAENGEGALALLEKSACAPDAILMDTQMPGLSGVALMEALRQRTGVSIYAISASQPPAEVEAAADRFIQKPFDAATLRHVLAERKVTQQKEEEQETVPEEPAVDAATLAQLRAMMPPSAVREIYETVVADLHRRLPALERAIGQGDTLEIQRTGHSIKGGCGLAGAVQAARIGALFESTSALDDGNQLDNSMALLRDLRAAVRRLERMLKMEFTS